MEFDKNKIKMKIAISKIKEEDVVMENKTKNVIKVIVTTVTSLLLGTGIVYAGTIVYEKIWKTPEKVEPTIEITEESKQENITEDDAKKIAIDKLNEIGFNSNIVSSKNYKEMDSNKIVYCFMTEDNYQISINGENGEFYQIWNYNKDVHDLNQYITREQAKEVANKYYQLFGYKQGEYELTDVLTLIR